MTKRIDSKEAVAPDNGTSLSMQALAIAGVIAVGGVIWVGMADAKSPPLDAAAGEAQALEATAEPGTEAPRPLAQGDDEAILRVVAEAERSEAGGHELYKRGLYPEALMVWQEAAEAGDAGAAYKIGAAYMDGQSVSHSFDEGLKWLRKSADMGDGRAMGDLGSAYDWGFGVEQDRTEAAKWFEQAALRGHAASQYNVGVLYEEGDGIEKDVVKAYMYYILANENGFPKYPAEAIEALTPKLTNDQIKRGVDAARAFKPI